MAAYHYHERLSDHVPSTFIHALPTPGKAYLQLLSAADSPTAFPDPEAPSGPYIGPIAGMRLEHEIFMALTFEDGTTTGEHDFYCGDFLCLDDTHYYGGWQLILPPADAEYKV